MKIKHTEVIIEEQNPFANCKLGRKQYAEVLSQIINGYGDGFVLAINNKWGTGKTTFVKMWQQLLCLDKHETVYFNAWENDFEDNPLTAIMGELKTLTERDNVGDFDNVLKKGAILTKNILPVLAKAFVARYVDVEELKDFAEKATEGMTSIFQEDVKLYSERKNSIKEFRVSLEKFINENFDGKPLVFIIDELDRCRPNYAVSVLEQIKHFFSVKGIIFVLSIDKEQLGNAVKGVYGTDRIDSDEYLRRFIDVEYVIPKPKTNEYCEYLYDFFDFGAFFNSDYRNGSVNVKNDGKNFLIISKILFGLPNISLRQIEKIFAHARIALKTFSARNIVFPPLFIVLIYLKMIHHSLYSKISLKLLSIEELQSEFYEILNFKNISEDDKVAIVFIEAYLIYYYNNYISDYYNRKMLFEVDASSREKKWLVSSKMDPFDQYDFKSNIEYIYRSDNSSLDIGYLLERIELLENVQV